MPHGLKCVKALFTQSSVWIVCTYTTFTFPQRFSQCNRSSFVFLRRLHKTRLSGAVRATGGFLCVDAVTWLGANAILVRSRSPRRAAPSLTCRGRPQQGGEQDGGHRQRRERGARGPGPPPSPRSPARGQGLHPHAAAAGRASAQKVVTWRAPTRRRKLADGGPEGRTDWHAATSARAVCGSCASLGASLGAHGRQGIAPQGAPLPSRPPHH